MTLTTHAIIGAAIAQFFPQEPVIGFAAALAMHYAVDVIPHFNVADYFGSIERKDIGKFRSFEGFIWGPRLFLDSAIVLFDLVLGFLLALLIWHSRVSVVIISIGVLGGVLPDLLQIAYGLWKNPVTTFFKKIHDFMHVAERWEIKSLIWGIITEIMLIAVIVWLAKYFV